MVDTTNSSRRRVRGLWLASLSYLTLCTVAIAQPLLQLYGDNVAVFVAANMEGSSVVWFGAAVLFVPPVLMMLVHAVSMLLGRSAERLVHLLLVFVGCWAFSSLMLRGVSLGPWALDMLVNGIVGTGLTWCYSNWSSVGYWIRMMSPLSLVVGVIFVTSASGVISPPDVSVVKISSTTAPPVSSVPAIPPSEVSVVWIVLDEAPLWPIMGTDGKVNAERFPGFAALAESSTWYRNALGTSQTTTQAVPSMLTGNWPTPGRGPVLANYPRNLFTLMNGHIAMDAHEVVTALCPRKVCATVSVSGGGDAPPSPSDTSLSEETVADATASTRGSVDVAGFLHDAAVVLGHKILPRGLRERLPSTDEGWGGFGRTSSSDPTDVDGEDQPASTTTVQSVGSTTVPERHEKAKSTTVAEWEKSGPVSQVPILEGITKRATRSALPTLHFAHVLLPHRPWSLNADLRQSHPIGVPNTNGVTIDRVRDQYQLFLLQYTAVDTLLGRLVSSLRRSANWERTMIVVTADHGITFEPGESKRKTINEKRAGLLDDIFRVPLFVKYPGQRAGTVDDCAASTIDILPTISSITGISAGWDMDGADLSKSCPQRRNRPVIWPDHTLSMSSGIGELLGRVRRYDRWVDANGGVDDIARTGRSADLVGKRVASVTNLVDSETSSVRIVLDNPEDFARVGSAEMARAPVHVRGTVATDDPLPDDAEGLIVVDGVIAGVVSELGGLSGGASESFRSTILPSVLTPGPHRVTMYMVTGSGTLRRLTLLG